MKFGVLGPVQVTDDGGELRLGGPKQRALVAILLLHANQAVSRDRLIDGLWGERPPASARHTLDDYVSRLRKALGDGRLVRRAPGFALTVRPDELDLECFERLVGQGQEALARGDPAAAEIKLQQALALWRGDALADILDAPFAQAERMHLEERRIAAIEGRIDAQLALGHTTELIGELEALGREHPFRERLTGQLMLALYRSGRQAEALAAASASRRRLADELGLQPGPALQQMEEAILTHDPALEGPNGRRPTAPVRSARAPPLLAHNLRSRQPSGRILVIVAIAAMVIVAGVILVWTSRSPRVLTAPPDSIGVIDATGNAISAVIQTGGRPGGIAAGVGAVWVTDTTQNQLDEIDPQHRSLERIPVGRPTGVATGGGAVWVVNQLDRRVAEINPRTLSEVDSFPVGAGADAIAFGAGSLWVANTIDDTLSHVDPAHRRLPPIPLPGSPAGVAVGRDGVWVTIPSTGQLVLIDARSDKATQAVTIGNGPTGVAVGGGQVWVADTPAGTLLRFDPGSGKITSINVGAAPVGVAYGAGAVWVANSLDGTVARVDPGSGSVTHIHVGSEPTALAATTDAVWSTVDPSPSSHRGGTLHVGDAFGGQPYASFGNSVDPAGWAGFSPWQILSLTNDGLVAYEKVGGLAGSLLVPDLATTLPGPTDNGTTYTFHLRRGIRYSTGAPVRPADFRRAIERVFSQVGCSGVTGGARRRGGSRGAPLGTSEFGSTSWLSGHEGGGRAPPSRRSISASALPALPPRC